LVFAGARDAPGLTVTSLRLGVGLPFLEALPVDLLSAMGIFLLSKALMSKATDMALTIYRIEQIEFAYR
jgi:hypothetical protein